ncbi:histidine kinase [Filomicrobium sp.]|uniref:histidine kinase n=1 Tax=Filomicrobium sp. TaxID=2024831 RepID=UPI00258586FD|nr:histidine kinase [Filomicrobium sp.]MCV0370873.1 HAMP domain-containing protein [Filomicrobium sp.]
MILTASESESKGGAELLPSLIKRLQNLWYRRPVRTQILIAFLAVTVVTSLFACFLKVLDAGNRTRIEMRASMDLAESFVRETARSLLNETEARNLLQTLEAQLKHLRHVRIEVVRANGERGPSKNRPPQEPSNEREPASVPRWFIEMVRPPANRFNVPIRVENQPIATVLIQGEPSDEIAEVWNDYRTMLLLWIGTNLLMLSALYVVLGRILDPLVGLAGAMKRLEHGHSAVRVEPPKVRELRLIADHFNQLAAALDAVNAENSRLCRDLITVQEEERRQIASELHDEVGPCLFGIMVNASSIEQYAQPLPEKISSEIASRISEIRTISDRLKSINRRLLKKLRPIALGRITLKELITKLSTEFELRHPNIRFSTITNDLQLSYGESIDLTIYRCIQEGITNALRHANPKNIVVQLAHETITGPDGEAAYSQISLNIRDDGEGIRDPAPNGFGLATMRERVRALNGTFSLSGNWPSGTAIDITVPAGRSTGEKRLAAEFFGNRA